MRTKALVLVFVLCVFFLKHKGQTYFNNRYDNFGGSDAATIIDTFNNYYLTAGFTCPFNTFRKLNLKLYNKITGNEIISKTYQRGTNDFGNANYTIKSKNKFSLCGTRSINNPDTSLVFLWQFDANLDSIKYNEYGYLNKRNEIYKMAYDNNKYYYMIGQVSDNLFSWIDDCTF